MPDSPSREIAAYEPATMLVRAIEQGLIGHSAMVERLMIALLTGGHVLIEGPPGLAKTRAVRRLAEGVEGSFARIQCTPDLMPADLTGTQVFRAEDSRMEFLPGPVFHSLVLVDEINRAPPKVQSALLEAMAEGQVTAGGVSRVLPEPFMVVATQNSLEHEGTFPLPEAQLDRFLFHVLVELPEEADERAILDLVESEIAAPVQPVAEHLSHSELAEMKRAVTQIHLSDALRDYIVHLVMATRRADPSNTIRARIEHPVSPRGSLALAASARARAFLHGRDYATPEDVEALAADVMAHRLILTWRAIADGETARGIVGEILEMVPSL